MAETNCFHNEFKRTVDHTIAGEMVYRCASNKCFGIFAVRALDFPDARTGMAPAVITLQIPTESIEIDGPVSKGGLMASIGGAAHEEHG
jgi:hypothetical protein